MVTGPFTVGSVGAQCAAASTVWMASTQSIVRTLCQLLVAYSYLEESVTRSQITSRLRCMYVAMADLLAVKQLPVVGLSVKARCWLPL